MAERAVADHHHGTRTFNLKMLREETDWYKIYLRER